MDAWLSKMYDTAGAASEPSAEEQTEKMAQALLIEKVAQANGIDLNQLSDEQIQLLSQEVLQQQAQPEGGQPQAGAAPGGVPGQGVPGQVPGQGMPGQGVPGGDMGAGGPVDPEQLALAQQILAQHQQFESAQQGAIQKEAEAKFAEADFLGRVMAHSFTQEMKKIASAQQVEEKKAELPGQGLAPAQNIPGAVPAQVPAITAAPKPLPQNPAQGLAASNPTAAVIDKIAHYKAIEMLKAAGYKVG